MNPAHSAAMLQLINGFHVSRALYVAAKLGLADLVSQGSQSSIELATATKTNSEALQRVIRVLASVGVFEILADKRVAKTDITATLLSDVPGSLRCWAIDQLGGEHYQAWGELLHSVRTGDVAFEQIFGKNAWDHRAENPQSAQEFDDGMSSYIGAHNHAVLCAYPFADLDVLYDLGGGDGQLIETILLDCPMLHGVLLEQAHVARKAQLRLTLAGLNKRCEVIEGNIFEAVPKNDSDNNSAYLLARVIHDWNDEFAIQILTVCRRTMTEKSILLLVERIMPECIDANQSTRALTVSDLNMLVMTGGCERTKTQYTALLEASGFEIVSIRSTETALSVIEARVIV